MFKIIFFHSYHSYPTVSEYKLDSYVVRLLPLTCKEPLSLGRPVDSQLPQDYSVGGSVNTRHQSCFSSDTTILSSFYPGWINHFISRPKYSRRIKEENMEKLHGPGATSDAKEYQNDHTKSNSDALTIGLAEEHSETPGMMIYDENDPKVPLPIVPFEHQLGPSNQPERDTDKTFGTGIFKELMSLIRRITSNTPTSIESSNLPVVVDTTDDPETLMELNSARLDENLRMRLQILLHRCLQLVIHNQLPLNKAAALALSLKPGSLSLQRYTVSWKPSDISCYIEYAYRYEDTKITKTWLTMASSHLLDAPVCFLLEMTLFMLTKYRKRSHNYCTQGT